MAKSPDQPPQTDTDAIVEEYLRRLDAGEQVDKDAFLAQYPDVAPALQSFFANEQLMRKWAADSRVPPGDTTPKEANPTVAPAVDPAKLSGPAGAVALPAMMGRYRIEKELGRGAMGAVYRAHDIELDRPVALKIPHFSSNDNPELISRFLREARSAAVLAHPNICRVYDVSDYQGTRYIAMEYIDGKPLTAFIGNVQPKQAASVIRKLALGLAEAHKQGIIHRDLKPDNILINSKGEPVLTDFGLARETTKASSKATQDGVILGSPAYMPPEQAAGNLSEMGPTSDIYSLGVVLYQMLVGDVPFRGSVVEVLAAVLMKTPKTVREAKPDVDPALAAICDKMMAKQAAERYQSMTEVASAVNDWLKTAASGQSAATASPAKQDALAGEMKIAEPATKSKLGSTHTITPRSTLSGAANPQASIPPGKKAPERTPQQLKDLAELVDQLLVRNDYLEAIRIVEEIPEYQRTPELRKLLGEGYQVKSTIEKLERQLEKHLNLVDIPALKKCVDQLLKLRPSHPRGKEIRKALNTEGKRGVLRIRKESGQFDAVGSVWEPWKLAAGVGSLLVMGVIAYFAVTIYIKGTMQDVAIEIDDPTAVVKIDGQTVDITGAGTGQIKLTLGNHAYTVERDNVTVKTAQSFQVTKDGKNVVTITLRDPKPGDGVAGTSPKPQPPVAAPSGTTPPLAVAPFDAAQAKAHQEAWAKHLGVPVEYTNSIGMKFRLIPPGEFLMGSTPEEMKQAMKRFGVAWNDTGEMSSEQPQHRVQLTKPFYVGVYEVTQAEYQAVMKQNPSHHTSTGTGLLSDQPGLDTSRYPVEWVCWDDIQEFCRQLSEQEKLQPFAVGKATGGTGYRLPTDAEWEYSCRAGTTTTFWCGDTMESVDGNMWHVGVAHERPRPVGQVNANPFGLFDMHGNVWEWVLDRAVTEYYASFQGKTAVDPLSPEGSELRIFRGGAANHLAINCRSTNRQGDGPTIHHQLIGFRVVLPVEAVKAARDNPQGAAKTVPAAVPTKPAIAWDKLPAPIEILTANGRTVDGTKSVDLKDRLSRELAEFGFIALYNEITLTPEQFVLELSLKLKTGDGKVVEGTVGYREMLYLDNRPTPDLPAQGLQILEAVYGAGLQRDQRGVDVKDKIQSFVRNEGLTADQVEMLGELDPAPFLVKALIVRYAYNGTIHTELFPQGHLLLLGKDAPPEVTLDELRDALKELVSLPGGQAVLITPTGNVSCTAAQHIPAGEFNIWSIEVVNAAEEADVRRVLTKFVKRQVVQSCRQLFITSPKVTSTLLPLLSQFTNARNFYVDGSGITDDGFEHLSKLRYLNDVAARSTEVTGTGFRHLQDLPITSVTLQTTKVNAEGMKQISELKKLASLSVWSPELTDEGVASLKNAKALRALNLERSPKLTEKGMIESLKGLGQLDHFNLQGGQFGDDIFDGLASLDDIVHLILVAPKATGKKASRLNKLKKLTNLHLSQLDLDDDGIERLATLKTVQHLQIDSNGRPIGKGLRKFKPGSPLTHLTLGQTRVYQDDLDAFKKNLPNVTVNVTNPQLILTK